MRGSLSLEERIYIIRKARVLVDDIGEKFFVLIELILEKLAVSEVYFVLESIDIETLVKGRLEVTEEVIYLNNEIQTFIIPSRSRVSMNLPVVGLRHTLHLLL